MSHTGTHERGEKTRRRRWQKNGRDTHIFNPSGLSLSVFSIVLILTGTTDYTWGNEIAATLNLAPHMYLWIFLVGLGESRKCRNDEWASIEVIDAHSLPILNSLASRDA